MKSDFFAVISFLHNHYGWIKLNRCVYDNGSINGRTYKVRPYLAVTTKTVYLKNTYTLDIRSATGTVTYATQDKSIAKINSKGVVTAVRAGTTYVIATNGSTTMKCTVNVYNPTLSKSKTTLYVGAKTVLTVNKSGGSGISWSSSDKTVARVTSNGTVTAVKEGTATISATVDGVTKSCLVKVKQEG